MHIPSPDAVIDRLRDWLALPEGCVALDPCCGTGHALRRLVPKGRLYGVELEIERAQAAGAGAAAGGLDHVIACAMQDAKISHNAFGLCLLNPPYDSSTEGRLEGVFLERCFKYLKPGGILVLILKVEQVAGPMVMGLLRRQFDVLGHWRFPKGYYDGPELAYTQTVLIARRRDFPCMDREPRDFYTNVLRLSGGRLGGQEIDGAIHESPDPIDLRLEEMPLTLDAEGTKIKVPVGSPPLIFISGMLHPEEMEKVLDTSPLSRVMKTPPALGCGRPPLPLKQGHVALSLAAGLVNGVYGREDDGSLHVAKGTVVRQKVKSVEVDDAGDRPAVVHKTTDTFAVKVRALVPAGVIYDMTGEPVEDAMDEDGTKEAA